MNIIRDFWADRQRRQTAMWVVGALGVIVLLFGGYVFLEAHNEYTRLDGTATALGRPTDPNDPSNRMLALLLRERDAAQVRRWQGVMFIGLGLVGLGTAYLLAPERPKAPLASADAAKPSSGEMPFSDKPPNSPPD
jgi:multisubunit Na+/H+ antiporter MnhB subunit